MPERFVTYPLHPQNTHTHLPRSVMTVTGFAYLEEKMKRFKRCFGNCTSTTGSVFICFSFSQPHQASEGLPWATEYHEKLGYSTAIQFCFFEEPSVWLRKLRQSPFRYEGAGLNRQRPGRKREASFSVDLQKCAGLEQ